MATSIEISGNNVACKVDYLNTDKCNTLINMKCSSTSKEPWNRLGRSSHIQKITAYVQEVLKPQYTLTEREEADCIEFLVKMNEKKRFSRQKDINFNREAGSIVSIPAVVFNETTRVFSLSNERKTNTVKNTTATKKTIKPTKQKNRIRSKTCDDTEKKVNHHTTRDDL
ncbi:MAG: hypothetical protein CMI56_02520 [Parcubacteria group bacterium]|nr:hypothetical protein [Parcubacteria group bacterium]